MQMATTTETLCAFRCGEPVHEDKRLCKKHLDHQRFKMAEYRQKRKQKGLCSRCDNTARLMPDGKTPSTLCDNCRTHVRTLEQQGRAKQARYEREILRMKFAGMTFKQISKQEDLEVEVIQQIITKGEEEVVRLKASGLSVTAINKKTRLNPDQIRQILGRLEGN